MYPKKRGVLEESMDCICRWILNKKVQWSMSHSQRAQWGKCEAAIQFQFTTTNNEAEYEAMITGMNIA
jgi:ribonuclease HI